MVEGGTDSRQILADLATKSEGRATRSNPSKSVQQYGVAKVRFQLPEQTPFSVLTRRHSGLVLILVGEQPTLGGRILIELDVIDSQSQDYLKELRKLPGVLSAARLGSRQSRTRFRMIVDPPRHVLLAIALEAVLRYPVVIKDGFCTLVVEAEVSHLRQLVRKLRRISSNVKLLSWGRENLPTFPPRLSSHQQALLYQAIATGYFDVPRRITLTALATQVHRSKSSVCRALSLIENRIVEASVLATL